MLERLDGDLSILVVGLEDVVFKVSVRDAFCLQFHFHLKNYFIETFGINYLNQALIGLGPALWSRWHLGSPGLELSL